MGKWGTSVMLSAIKYIFKKNGVAFTRREVMSQLLCKSSAMLGRDLETKLPSSSERLQNPCDQDCSSLNSFLLSMFAVHWGVQMQQTGPTC